MSRKLYVNYFAILCCIASGMLWYAGVVGLMAFVKWCER